MKAVLVRDDHPPSGQPWKVYGPFSSVADVPDELGIAFEAECERPFLIDMLPGGHYYVFDERRSGSDRRFKAWGRRANDLLLSQIALQDMAREMIEPHPYRAFWNTISPYLCGLAIVTIGYLLWEMI